MSICTNMHIHTYLYVYAYVCICVYMYAYIYVLAAEPFGYCSGLTVSGSLVMKGKKLSSSLVYWGTSAPLALKVQVPFILCLQDICVVLHSV